MNFLVDWSDDIRVVGTAMMKWKGAMKQVEISILSLIHDRLREGTFEDTINPRPVCDVCIYSSGNMADAAKADCVQWIMESYKEKNQGTIKKAVDQTIGLLLASAHQFPMVRLPHTYVVCATQHVLSDPQLHNLQPLHSS